MQAPRPAEEWGGLRDASKEGPLCPQGHPAHPDGVRGEEDCLYLNVYSPASALAEEANETQPQPLLPVIFMVHGGFFYKVRSFGLL